MFTHRIDGDTELRLIESHDAEQLNALIEQNRDHIKKWSAWLKDDHSIEKTRTFVERNLKQFAEHQGFASAIWFKGEMVGQIEYNYIDWANRKTEIGYWLGASFQGKGLMTNSCRVLIDYAFNELKLNRVEMQCDVENYKSRKIPANLGFKEEGVIRQAGWRHDRFVDFVVYGLLAEEWENKAEDGHTQNKK